VRKISLKRENYKSINKNRKQNTNQSTQNNMSSQNNIPSQNNMSKIISLVISSTWEQFKVGDRPSQAELRIWLSDAQEKGLVPTMVSNEHLVETFFYTVKSEYERIVTNPLLQEPLLKLFNYQEFGMSPGSVPTWLSGTRPQGQGLFESEVFLSENWSFNFPEECQKVFNTITAMFFTLSMLKSYGNPKCSRSVMFETKSHYDGLFFAYFDKNDKPVEGRLCFDDGSYWEGTLDDGGILTNVDGTTKVCSLFGSTSLLQFRDFPPCDEALKIIRDVWFKTEKCGSPAAYSECRTWLSLREEEEFLSVLFHIVEYEFQKIFTNPLLQEPLLKLFNCDFKPTSKMFYFENGSINFPEGRELLASNFTMYYFLRENWSINFPEGLELLASIFTMFITLVKWKTYGNAKLSNSVKFMCDAQVTTVFWGYFDKDDKPTEGSLYFEDGDHWDGNCIDGGILTCADGTTIPDVKCLKRRLDEAAKMPSVNYARTKTKINKRKRAEEGQNGNEVAAERKGKMKAARDARLEERERQERLPENVERRRLEQEAERLAEEKRLRDVAEAEQRQEAERIADRLAEDQRIAALREAAQLAKATAAENDRLRKWAEEQSNIENAGIALANQVEGERASLKALRDEYLEQNDVHQKARKVWNSPKP